MSPLGSKLSTKNADSPKANRNADGVSVKASARGVRMSPRKVGVVAGLVRGRTVEDALTILEHTPRGSALPVSKLIESARANADHNHNLKPETLTITSITVTPAARYKRYKKGRGYRGGYDQFQLKSSHIFVEVDGEKRQPKKPVANKTQSKPVAKEKKA